MNGRLVRSDNIPDVLFEEIESVKNQLIEICENHSIDVVFNSLSLTQSLLISSVCENNYNKMEAMCNAHIETIKYNLKEFAKLHETEKN